MEDAHGMEGGLPRSSEPSGWNADQGVTITITITITIVITICTWQR